MADIMIKPILGTPWQIGMTSGLELQSLEYTPKNQEVQLENSESQCPMAQLDNYNSQEFMT